MGEDDAGESMEDYAIRVNDETRVKQQQLFAQEVATALAGDRISMDNPLWMDMMLLIIC